MKVIIKYLIAVITITFSIFSCQKQIDYGPEIALLKSDVASLKSSITTITAQLTSLEASLKAKIDLTNAKIDVINSDINTLNTKTIAGLTTDILAINSSIKNTNAESTKRLDSLRTTILKIDTSINGTAQSVTSLSELYNKLLTNYVEILKIIKSTLAVVEINGSVFKGSFIRGSLLNFYELDSKLNQTGRSFNTTIDDDYGNFDIKAQNLAGKLIRVVGDGFYWNEVLNENSSSRITLTALSKIDSNETVNVNVLTQLERPRVEYLYGVKGLSFDSAKTQAVTEVLKAFGFANTGIKRAEKVGVVGIGDDSKILLAISTLMQGFRTESEVTQIMSDFANDLKKDGILDDAAIGMT
jgi:outer membrane murein-binding lipoprotein Lpp